MVEAPSSACTEMPFRTAVSKRAKAATAHFHQQPAPTEIQRMLVINGMTARAVNEGSIKTPTTDIEPVIGAYDGPVLLTPGVHDRSVRTAMAERIQALRPGRRLSIYAESRHSPFYEERVRYGRELAMFTGVLLEKARSIRRQPYLSTSECTPARPPPPPSRSPS